MAVLTTGTSGLTGQYQKYFDKRLLTAVLQLLVMDQFGQVRPLPPNMGALTVRFTRPPAPDRTTVLSLSEGVAPSTDRAFAWSHIDATLAQVGQKSTISDILGATNLFDTLKGMSTLMGQDAAHYLDFAITTEIVPNATTNIIYAGSGNAGAGNTTFANIGAAFNATTANSAIRIQDVLRAFSKLVIARAPTVAPNDRAPKARGGDYVCVLPPQLAYDVKLDTKFVDAGVRGNNDGLFHAEMGTWYGMRMVLGTQPWREGTTAQSGALNTYSSTGGVYTAIGIGSEQFGVVNLASQSPFSPKLMVVDSPDSANPLNQFTTVGWKGFFVVKTLKEDWAAPIRAQSTLS